MKHPFLTITILGMIGALPTLLLAAPAKAENTNIENALSRRDDLSLFYQAFLNTGVANELRSGVPYTVFAPTNAAFSKLNQPSAECYQSADCREDLARVVRHHIVEGEQHVSDNKGAVFSIDEYHINIGQPFKNKYTVDGNRILSQNQLAGSMLYRINGVILDKNEKAALLIPRDADYSSDAPRYAPASGGEVTTNKVYYSPSGRVDGSSQTVAY